MRWSNSAAAETQMEPETSCRLKPSDSLSHQPLFSHVLTSYSTCTRSDCWCCCFLSLTQPVTSLSLSWIHYSRVQWWWSASSPRWPQQQFMVSCLSLVSEHIQYQSKVCVYVYVQYMYTVYVYIYIYIYIRKVLTEFFGRGPRKTGGRRRGQEEEHNELHSVVNHHDNNNSPPHKQVRAVSFRKWLHYRNW